VTSAPFGEDPGDVLGGGGIRLEAVQPTAHLAWPGLGCGHVVGTVEGTPSGSLTMLRLPGDSFVTIELVHDPERGAVDVGTGINHLVVQVDSLDLIVADLAAQGIVTEPTRPPDRADEPRTSWLTDPDGYRIELVQWPAGHADGITEADFA
jgi:lactoylglutathione lyase